MYYNFEEPVKKIAGHRVLALNRGEAEKVLTVKVNAPEERILRYLGEDHFRIQHFSGSIHYRQLTSGTECRIPA